MKAISHYSKKLATLYQLHRDLHTQALIERRRADANALLFLIQTSVPNRHLTTQWGDWNFAQSLAAALRRRGHGVIVTTRDQWHRYRPWHVDVNLHLHGRGQAPRHADEFQVLWLISHPEEAESIRLQDVDLLLVASLPYATYLSERLSTVVRPFLQATDVTHYTPEPSDLDLEVPNHRLLYIANARSNRLRTTVRYALASGIVPAIYGSGWRRWLDASLLSGKNIPHAEMPSYYRSAEVVLNDHWEDMRRWGFLSNRLFDVLACRTAVISDHVPGIHDVFSGTVKTYHDENSFARGIEELLADPAERHERAATGSDIVRSHHSFDRRTEQLESLILKHR